MARNACLFISFTFISCLFVPIVQASTPHSIVNFDGSLDDWPQDSHMSTDNGLDFHMTWNETHLFFGLEGTEFSSQWGGDLTFSFISTPQQAVRLLLTPLELHRLCRLMLIFVYK